MILTKTPWLYLDDCYCFRDKDFACADVLNELWELDPKEEIQFEIHSDPIPESYMVELTRTETSPRWILRIGFDWALVSFHIECRALMEEFYKKNGTRFCWLKCVGRK